MRKVRASEDLVIWGEALTQNKLGVNLQHVDDRAFEDGDIGVGDPWPETGLV